MSYYKKSSPVPWIAGAVLLAGFVAIVVHYSGDDAGDPNAPPFARGVPLPPAPTLVPEPEPEPPPVEEPYEPPPPPKPTLSPAQAEQRLRAATKEWRAFTVRLTQRERWKSPRAVAFLQKVTWNDRDLEKQHAHGLEAIRTMLGVSTTDPVAIAEALEERGNLTTFFDRNWSKVDVGAAPEPDAKEAVLEDMWKPNRIRWGFPLDTPVENLQQFKHVSLALCQRLWEMLSGAYVQGLDILETEKRPKWLNAVGQGYRAQEAKLQAALRVLVDKPDGSLREVVEEFVTRIPEESKREEFIKSFLENRPKLEKAVKAAEGAG